MSDLGAITRIRSNGVIMSRSLHRKGYMNTTFRGSIASAVRVPMS